MQICSAAVKIMSSLPDISVALGWKPGPVDKELDENVLASKFNVSRTCFFDK